MVEDHRLKRDLVAGALVVGGGGTGTTRGLDRASLILGKGAGSRKQEGCHAVRAHCWEEEHLVLLWVLPTQDWRGSEEPQEPDHTHEEVGAQLRASSTSYLRVICQGGTSAELTLPPKIFDSIRKRVWKTRKKEKKGLKNAKKRIRTTMRNVSEKFLAPLLPLKLKTYFTGTFLKLSTAEYLHNCLFLSQRRSAGVVTLIKLSVVLLPYIDHNNCYGLGCKSDLT